MAVTGSCLCDRIAFEVSGALRYMSHCYCGFCRKSHGSQLATYVGAERLRFTKGAGEQQGYASSPGMTRFFCPTCGSKVPGPEPLENVFLPVGLLDGDPGARPEAHIFTGARAPWVEVTDGLPAFEGAPPGYPDPELAARPRPAAAREGTIAGSCLCGAVAWEQEGTPDRMGHCHCSRCRKLRGAPFSTQVFSTHERFHWLSGREKVVEYQLPGALFYGNSFCEDCGSPVARDVEGAPVVLIPAGNLDDDPGIAPQAHIYVASKAPWVEISDDLPCFDEMPPGA